MEINKLTLVEVLRTAIAISLSIVLIFIIIFIVSDTPLTAISDFLLGPLSTTRRIGNVFEATVPLMFTGLAVTLLYRAGLFNLSMEGAFFIGSVASTAAALSFNLPPIINLPLAMLCGALAGGFVTFIPGFLKVKCHANELVTSLMLNYVCLHVGLFIIKTYYFDPKMSANYSYKLGEGMQLTRFIPGTRINTGIIIALACVFVVWLILNKTSFGYKVTVVGKNKVMAKYAGIGTGFAVLGSQFLGGIFAGLGGAVDLFGMYQRFQYSGLTGYGWDGVLIAIVAFYKAQYIPLAALFLAYLRTGADIMSRNSDIPFEIVKVIQALVIVLISVKVILSKYRRNIIVREAIQLEKEKGGTEYGHTS